MSNSNRDNSVIVCSRVEDLVSTKVVTNSRITKCFKCNSDVWVSTTTLKATSHLGDLKCMCLQCSFFTQSSEEEVQVMMLTESQRKELRDRGITDKEIDRLFDYIKSNVQRKGGKREQRSQNS